MEARRSDEERIHGDIFIDDKYEHVRSWFDYWLSQNNDYVIPVLWQTDRTINTEVVDGVTVATNWNQVVQLVHNQSLHSVWLPRSR
jgi:hypothetical protein